MIKPGNIKIFAASVLLTAAAGVYTILNVLPTVNPNIDYAYQILQAKHSEENLIVPMQRCVLEDGQNAYFIPEGYTVWCPDEDNRVGSLYVFSTPDGGTVCIGKEGKTDDVDLIKCGYVGVDTERWDAACAYALLTYQQEKGENLGPIEVWALNEMDGLITEARGDNYGNVKG